MPGSVSCDMVNTTSQPCFSFLVLCTRGSYICLRTVMKSATLRALSFTVCQFLTALLAILDDDRLCSTGCASSFCFFRRSMLQHVIPLFYFVTFRKTALDSKIINN